MASLKDLKILFIANYADQIPKLVVNEFPELGIAPFYHNEIKTILKKLSNNVTTTSDIKFLINDAENFDYVFTLLNQAKFRNSEVFVSAVCEYFKVPYLGGPPNIRAVAEDKHLTKLLAKNLNIPTPRWQCIDKGDIPKNPQFEGPYFIKPRMGASSYGITEESSQIDWNGAIRIIKSLHSKGYDVIIEEFIEGKNVTFPIIGGFEFNYFECIESFSNTNGNIILNCQKRKVKKGLFRELYLNSPKNLIKEYSRIIFKEIQPLDYARFDFRVDEKTGIPYFIELNICSNLGNHSTIMQSIRTKKITQEDLIKHIINYSLKRQISD